MALSAQIFLIINFFFISFFFVQFDQARKRGKEDKIKSLQLPLRIIVALNIFIAAVFSNHIISGDMDFYDAVRYTFNEPLEVAFDFAYISLFIIVIHTLLVKSIKIKLIVRHSQEFKLVLSTLFIALFSFVITPSEYEHEYNRIDDKVVQKLKNACPNGIRIEPNQFNYLVTCYQDTGKSVDITYDYNGPSYKKYLSLYWDRHENLLDLTHDIYLKDYDSGKINVRMLYTDLSGSLYDYNKTHHGLIEVATERFLKSIYWNRESK